MLEAFERLNLLFDTNRCLAGRYAELAVPVQTRPIALRCCTVDIVGRFI